MTQTNDQLKSSDVPGARVLLANLAERCFEMRGQHPGMLAVYKEITEEVIPRLHRAKPIKAMTPSKSRKITKRLITEIVILGTSELGSTLSVQEIADRFGVNSARVSEILRSFQRGDYDTWIDVRSDA